MRTIEEFRAFKLNHLRECMQLPGMRGDPHMNAVLAVHELCFIDERENTWQKETERLYTQGRWDSRGFIGPLLRYLPIEKRSSGRNECASVVSEVLHRLGYLQLDRELSNVEIQEMIHSIQEFRHGSWHRSDVERKFGPPSFYVHQTVWCYATKDTEVGWIYFDFDFEPTIYATYDPGDLESSRWPTIDGKMWVLHPHRADPFVREIRYPAAKFTDGLLFTEFGDQIRKLESERFSSPKV